MRKIKAELLFFIKRKETKAIAFWRHYKAKLHDYYEMSPSR
jgi:hypothetical protein